LPRIGRQNWAFGRDPNTQTRVLPGSSGANVTDTGDDGGMARFVSVEELSKGRHLDQEFVLLCVRWYLSSKLYRDLVAMLGKRGN
jgi:hypothetical protein